MAEQKQKGLDQLLPAERRPTFPKATGDTVAAVPVAAAPGLPVPTDRRRHAALIRHRDASIELSEHHLQAVDPGPAARIGPCVASVGKTYEPPGSAAILPT